MATHEVTNQVPILSGHDTSADPALREALVREGAEWALPDLERIGRLAGSVAAQELGRPFAAPRRQPSIRALSADSA